MLEGLHADMSKNIEDGIINKFHKEAMRIEKLNKSMADKEYNLSLLITVMHAVEEL